MSTDLVQQVSTAVTAHTDAMLDRLGKDLDRIYSDGFLELEEDLEIAEVRQERQRLYDAALEEMTPDAAREILQEAADRAVHDRSCNFDASTCSECGRTEIMSNEDIDWEQAQIEAARDVLSQVRAVARETGGRGL